MPKRYRVAVLIEVEAANFKDAVEYVGDFIASSHEQNDDAGLIESTEVVGQHPVEVH